MAERPIIMTGTSVPAILERRKTQTRRVVTRQSVVLLRAANLSLCGAPGQMLSAREWDGLNWDRCKGRPCSHDRLYVQNHDAWECRGIIDCHELAPRWKVGDRLWVREQWVPTYGELAEQGIAYRADKSIVDHAGVAEWREQFNRGAVHDVEIAKAHSQWRSPRFMPKWAARLWIEVTALGFERLQNIPLEDCHAEGVRIPVTMDGHVLIELTGKYPASHYLRPLRDSGAFSEEELCRAYFASGWDERNARRGFPWEDNPLVLVVSFKLAEVRKGVSVPS